LGEGAEEDRFEGKRLCLKSANILSIEQRTPS
jgi:hypothetical protein